jgi:hypothetical protein
MEQAIHRDESFRDKCTLEGVGKTFPVLRNAIILQQRHILEEKDPKSHSCVNIKFAYLMVTTLTPTLSIISPATQSQNIPAKFTLIIFSILSSDFGSQICLPF